MDRCERFRDVATASFRACKIISAPLDLGYHKPVTRQTASWIGFGACTIAAAALIPLFHESSSGRIVPLLFLAVIFVISTRFGRMAGFLGTLAAALIFATFLFSPVPSPIVEDIGARNHLIWMILIGVIASDLLGAYVVPRNRKKS